MQKYLFYGSYTPEGYRGLLSEGGSQRVEAVTQALADAGGTLEALYFSFGENDFYIIVNLPDNVSATAVTYSGNLSGSFRIKVITLLTPLEMDRVSQMSINFRPPGR